MSPRNPRRQLDTSMGVHGTFVPLLELFWYGMLGEHVFFAWWNILVWFSSLHVDDELQIIWDCSSNERFHIKTCMLHVTGLVHDGGAAANSFCIFAGLILFLRSVFFSFRSQSTLLLRSLLLSRRVWQRCDHDGGGWVERLFKLHIPMTSPKCPTSVCWEVQMENLPTSSQPEGPKHQKWLHRFTKRFPPLATGFVVRPFWAGSWT